MLGRRGFIGSILGTIVATQLPFKVEEPIVCTYDTLLTKYERYVRTFRLIQKDKQFVIDNFRTNILISLVDGAEELIKGPGLETINSDQKDALLTTEFKVKPMLPNKSMTCVGCELFDDKNYRLKSWRFGHPICLLTGDTLNLTMTLGLGS